MWSFDKTDHFEYMTDAGLPTTPVSKNKIDHWKQYHSKAIRKIKNGLGFNGRTLAKDEKPDIRTWTLINKANKHKGSFLKEAILSIRYINPISTSTISIATIFTRSRNNQDSWPWIKMNHFTNFIFFL